MTSMKAAYEATFAQTYIFNAYYTGTNNLLTPVSQ